VKVLVTGATGFVGSHLVELLCERGHAVRCLARNPAKLEELLPGLELTLVHGALDDHAALRRAVSGVDAVVHVAGLTAARRRRDFYDVNAEGTRALVEAASSGAKLTHFIHVSSLAAAGPSTRGTPTVVGAESGPVSQYGASKLLGEEIVRGSSLPWTIVRPPAVYGPRDRAFLPLFRLLGRGWNVAFGDGRQELSMVYAPDLVQALADCLDHPATGAVYHAAHPAVCTARELALGMRTALGVHSPRTLTIPGFLVRPLLTLSGGAARLMRQATMLSRDKSGEILAEAWTCSSASIERDLGWRANTDLASGLTQTVEWYRAEGWLARPREPRGPNSPRRKRTD